MGFDNGCVLRIESVPHMYFCICCRALVCPDEALQAPCKHLICTSCLIGAQSCPDDLSLMSENNCKPLLESNKPLAEMIGKVMVCCRNHKSGCLWQGILSDYATHGTSCIFENSHIVGSSTQCRHIQVQGPAQNDKVLPSIIGQEVGEPIGQGSSALGFGVDNTKEMARKYANAYYLWTWHERVIERQTVLSRTIDHGEGMALFYSTTSALEANLRVKGYVVNELSPNDLCAQYTDINKEPSFGEMSELLKVIQILKNTGVTELNPHGSSTMRRTIVDYKVFNTKTIEGLSDALDHLRIHGPLVGVYYVTEYQKRYTDSFGILHGVEADDRIAMSVSEEADDRIASSTSSGTLHGVEADDRIGMSVSEEADDRIASSTSSIVCVNGKLKNTICITGFGVEDSCPFFQFQKFRRVQYENRMFARVLVSSIIELVGLFC